MSEFSGGEFDRNYNEFNNERIDETAARDAYTEAVKEYGAGSEAAKVALEKFNIQLARTEVARGKVFDSVAKEFKVSDDLFEKIDWTKSLDIDNQPAVKEAGLDEQLKEFETKMTSTLETSKGKFQAKLKEIGIDVAEDEKVFETKTNPVTGEIEVADDENSQNKAKKIKDFLGEHWLKLLLLAGGIVGALFVYDFFKKVACNFAKSESKCYAIDPKTGKQEEVKLIASVEAGCTYDIVCGGCSHGVLQPGVEAKCCSAVSDAEQSKHKGWNYSQVCKSGADSVIDFFKAIGDLFSPANILKIIKILAIIIGGVIGLMIMFKIMGLIFKKKKKD